MYLICIWDIIILHTWRTYIKHFVQEVSIVLSGTDPPVSLLWNIVPIDETFGYVDDVDTTYQVLSEFGKWKRQDFVRSIPKKLENFKV